ncbi:hypothetical protein V1478_012262 [Vespula squamosa]|uniref:Uncharacterized protein n=1 Tax=Vespula squamosa TaxID=30214 RepID=A0ABD2ADA6_VESSQ
MSRKLVMAFNSGRQDKKIDRSPVATANIKATNRTLDNIESVLFLIAEAELEIESESESESEFEFESEVETEESMIVESVSELEPFDEDSLDEDGSPMENKKRRNLHGTSLWIVSSPERYFCFQIDK